MLSITLKAILNHRAIHPTFSSTVVPVAMDHIKLTACLIRRVFAEGV